MGNALKGIAPTAEHKHRLIIEAVRNRFQYGVRLDVPVYRNLLSNKHPDVGRFLSDSRQSPVA